MIEFIVSLDLQAIVENLAYYCQIIQLYITIPKIEQKEKNPN